MAAAAPGTGARTDRTGTGLAAAGEHLNPPPRLATPRSSGRGQVAAAAGLASWGDGPVEQAGLPGAGGGGGEWGAGWRHVQGQTHRSLVGGGFFPQAREAPGAGVDWGGGGAGAEDL